MCVPAGREAGAALPAPPPPPGAAQAGTGVAPPRVWKPAREGGQLRAQEEEEPWEPRVAWWWGDGIQGAEGHL